jgi:hypothetical protein
MVRSYSHIAEVALALAFGWVRGNLSDSQQPPLRRETPQRQDWVGQQSGIEEAIVVQRTQNEVSPSRILLVLGHATTAPNSGAERDWTAPWKAVSTEATPSLSALYRWSVAQSELRFNPLRGGEMARH